MSACKVRKIMLTPKTNNGHDGEVWSTFFTLYELVCRKNHFEKANDASQKINTCRVATLSSASPGLETSSPLINKSDYLQYI